MSIHKLCECEYYRIGAYNMITCEHNCVLVFLLEHEAKMVVAVPCSLKSN